MADSSNSDQLAHNWHTVRRVGEIKALIETTENLATKFEKLLARRSPCPEHHPMVERDHRWVLLDMKTQPLRPIDGSEEAAAKLIAAKADFSIVESPFNPASWPASLEKPTVTQKQMLVWLDEFDKLLQRCQDHFVFWEGKDILALFPLANPRSGTFYPNAHGIVAGLGRQVELLVRQLDDPREFLLLRVRRDLACVLKEARRAFPYDKQATAAYSIGVSIDALKRWESGERQKLRAKSRARIETYVLKKLLRS